MSARRIAASLSALVLVAPLAALGMPACGPGEHCPMTGLMGGEAPCHGAAIQADDCCVTSAVPEAAEHLPVVATSGPAVVDPAPAPGVEPVVAPRAAAPIEVPSPPLYRLYRALLI